MTLPYDLQCMRLQLNSVRFLVCTQAGSTNALLRIVMDRFDHYSGLVLKLNGDVLYLLLTRGHNMTYCELGRRRSRIGLISFLLERGNHSVHLAYHLRVV